jgi:hypothetical protein
MMGWADGRGLMMRPVKGAKLEAILREVESLALEQLPIGAGHSGTDHPCGWIEGLANVRLVQSVPSGEAFNRLIEFPAMASAIGELMKMRSKSGVFQVMINRLDPGGSLAKHRDGMPIEPAPERWHLPIISNPLVEYWEEALDGPIHLSIGSWWGPISYWDLHSMVNLGEFPRVHIIVDLYDPEIARAA